MGDFRQRYRNNRFNNFWRSTPFPLAGTQSHKSINRPHSAPPPHRTPPARSQSATHCHAPRKRWCVLRTACWRDDDRGQVRASFVVGAVSSARVARRVVCGRGCRSVFSNSNAPSNHGKLDTLVWSRQQARTRATATRVVGVVVDTDGAGRANQFEQARMARW